MSNATKKTERPPQTSLQLSAAARAQLDRIKQVHGVNKVRAVERGILLLKKHLKGPAL